MINCVLNIFLLLFFMAIIKKTNKITEAVSFIAQRARREAKREEATLDAKNKKEKKARVARK